MPWFDFNNAMYKYDRKFFLLRPLSNTYIAVLDNKLVPSRYDVREKRLTEFSNQFLMSFLNLLWYLWRIWIRSKMYLFIFWFLVRKTTWYTTFEKINLLTDRIYNINFRFSVKVLIKWIFKQQSISIFKDESYGY